jgi:hypothetical protein
MYRVNGSFTYRVFRPLRGWREDPEFRESFNQVLAGVPFEGFRWETPAVTVGTLGRGFEFVVLEAPEVVRAADSEAFAGHFDQGQPGGVVTFANLGGDAMLVVPGPGGEEAAYGHLGAFVRGAPPEQRRELWRAVGEAMGRRVGERAVWLSTAGAGVAWLHVRLDDRPKYYAYAPYRGIG